jgi:putative FmdB family regulatory protein
MPTYVIHCQVCGEQETVERISRSQYADCPVCQRPRVKIPQVIQFTEDRLRMWSGPLGNGFSTALGEKMPDTRAGRDRLAAKKGLEFITKSELVASNKEAAEAIAYKADVDRGLPHQPIGAGDTSAFKPPPTRYKDKLG